MRKFIATIILFCLPLVSVPPLVAQSPHAAGASRWQASAAQAPAGSAAKQAAPAAKPLDGIDAFIAEQLTAWKNPGVSVAVIQNGKVILLKGYGYRNVEEKLPVTPQTLFAIGSITKSFTVTSLGMLADEGKIDFDKPVRDFLPKFQLNDPVASDRATPRDLVSHRTGLPRHDALWYGSSLSRQELFERLRYLEPSKDFRQLYQYNNLMFMTAGILVEQASGKRWEDFVRERIFAPLGMKASNFSVTDSQKTPDAALPYQEDKGVIKRVPYRNIDAVGPAGSINSNAEEMIRYVQFHMQRGKFGDKQLLSAAMAQQMHSPQTVVPGEPAYPELGPSAYCLGLLATTYRGHRMITHGGAIDGFNAHISFMPADNIGVVILANRSGAVILNTLSRYIYDRLLGLDVIDWTKRIKDQQAKQKASEEEAKKKGYTGRRDGTRPSHDLKEYAGEYEHPGYGIIKIAVAGDALTFTYNGMTSPLKHFHYDYFEVPENDLDPFGEAKVSFRTNVAGDIGSLTAPLEPALKDIEFTRRGEAVSKDVLQSLAGTYVLGAQTITFTVSPEGKLVLTLPGQPAYELVPTRGLNFDIKGLQGFRVEFKKDASGAVNEAAFFQPNGTFVAKRK